MPRRPTSARLQVGPLPLGPVVVVGAIIAVAATAGLEPLLTGLTAVTEIVFVLFFLRYLTFSGIALGATRDDLDAAALGPVTWPTVAVIVACHNEQAVVDVLVDHLLALQYPGPAPQLVVVDDGSTDATGRLLDARAAAEPRLAILHRPAGAGGGKSGALNAAVAAVEADVVVVFDADHRPRPDCLWRLARHFADPLVGAAQGRCVIVNGDDSPLAELVAIDYLAGYLVDEFGRQAVHGLPAYGGANCAVRTRALQALGGWNEDSVTDDTDLTLRLILDGWQVRYDVTAVDEEEGAVTLRQYWRQRYRWARGHQQVWRDYHRDVWRAPHLSWTAKVELTMFLLIYHVPVLSLFGLVLGGTVLAGLTAPPTPAGLFVLWTLLLLGPLFQFTTGLLVAGKSRSAVWAIALFLPLFVLSTVLCTKAWVDGLLRRRYAWVKTARAAEVRRDQQLLGPQT